MRIGFNCLRTWPNYWGGINSFTFGLLDGFVANQRGHEFTIFGMAPNRHMLEKYHAIPNFRVLEINETNHALERSQFEQLPWEVRYELPMPLLNRWLNAEYTELVEKECDIVYVPYAPTPLFPYTRKKPSVFSIHDIQHVHFPDFFTPHQQTERKVNFAQCVRRATVIQASSRYMRDDFLEYFGALDPDRVVVIREGVNVEYFKVPRDAADVVGRYQLPNSFLFLPAQLWYHKNHMTLLRALERLRQRKIELPLVLTGQRYEASQAIFDFIEQSGLAQQVFHLGVVPFDDVVALYQAARLLVMPSLYESSSIPILEAAAAGTGIVASRIPPNVEFSENLKMELFTPTDDEELAALLLQLWEHPDAINHQIKHNKCAVEMYSWRSVADDYVNLFESMMPHNKGAGRQASLQ